MARPQTLPTAWPQTQVALLHLIFEAGAAAEAALPGVSRANTVSKDR